MKKKKVFKYAGFCFMLLLLMVPKVSAGWEDMEVLKYYFEIDTGPRYQWPPSIAYNPIDNEFIGFWRTEGKIRDDCEEGDDYECTHNFHSIDGRRISPDGELLGDPIQLVPPDENEKNRPSLAHNIFTNEYLIATPTLASPAPYEVYISIIDNLGNIKYGPEPIYEGGKTTVLLPQVFFNTKRREYLVLYDDRNIFNSYLNNVGFFLDENAHITKGPFEIGNQVGDMYAQRLSYNWKDDTYLVAWEDFRHVAGDWTANCDIYGALLDAGGGIVTEVPIMDDAGMEDEGDQRVPVPCYNPDRNEFLVVFKDRKPSLDEEGIVGAGIVGRIINADGIPQGPVFVIIDEPRIQHWPELQYIEEEKKYFMIWNDFRNDGEPPGTRFYQSTDMDVYARWLDPSGQPVGDEILIADAVEWQMTPLMA
ncbi:MAG: hypothetical protein V3R78_10375, partial [Thermodesulfobacteriota bacterium]